MRLIPAGRIALTLLLVPAPTVGLAQQPTTFSAGEWKTECSVDRMTDRRGCITRLGLNKTNPPVGIFSLIISSVGPSVSMVGSPTPYETVIRIDRNPAMECKGIQVCQFSRADSSKIVRQLYGGTTLLVTVLGSGVFEFTKEIGHYRTMLAKHQEWGYAR